MPLSPSSLFSGDSNISLSWCDREKKMLHRFSVRFVRWHERCDVCDRQHRTAWLSRHCAGLLHRIRVFMHLSDLAMTGGWEKLRLDESWWETTRVLYTVRGDSIPSTCWQLRSKWSQHMAFDSGRIMIIVNLWRACTFELFSCVLDFLWRAAEIQGNLLEYSRRISTAAFSNRDLLSCGLFH